VDPRPSVAANVGDSGAVFVHFDDPDAGSGSRATPPPPINASGPGGSVNDGKRLSGGFAALRAMADGLAGSDGGGGGGGGTDGGGVLVTGEGAGVAAKDDDDATITADVSEGVGGSGAVTVAKPPLHPRSASVSFAAAAEVRLLPIRPRSRGARRSLRTFPVVTLHPRFPFNV